MLPAGREVGEYLVTHPGIDKVGFTGSTAAGRRIAALCGERLRRVTLELGGKSAAIVCDDADLEQVIAPIVGAGTMNNGQACVAQTRVLLPRTRYKEGVEALAAAVGNLRVGDPADFTTEIGPLVSDRQRDRVLGYIAKGKAEGARCVVGGGTPKDQARGWFVTPTLFADVDNRMTVAQEEIFGPVLCAIPYDDEADAIRIANDSALRPLGLGLDQRPAARHRHRPPRPHRHPQRQLLHDGDDGAVRRLQGFRARPRARSGRAPRVPRAEDDLPGAGDRAVGRP